MEIGMIGLGKMGLNLVANMQRNGNSVVAFDLNKDSIKKATETGAKGATSIDELISTLAKPATIWVMVPAGKPTQAVIDELAEKLEPGDTVIDGGNSFFQDSIKHNELLSSKDIFFFDVGTSGGMEGAYANGNFMIGGDAKRFKDIEPLFEGIAQKDGYLYTGPAGSGHYLKMVHNGIEYGMMQAIGEGFDVLEHSQFKYDNEAVARVWSHGSVIRSWLMELSEDAFKKDPNLDKIAGVVASSGEGLWYLGFHN